MDPYRLPRQVLPTRYDLRLEPDLEKAVFSGEVIVTIDGKEATSTVVLNAADLTIEQAGIINGTAMQPAALALDPETERCWLTFPEPIPPGQHRLCLRFRGTLQRQAAWLLPQHVPGRRRPRPDSGSHAVRGDRRPACLSLLGRAQLQGGILDHAGDRPPPDRAVQYRRR